MSGECPICGEHTLDCVCETISVRQLLFDFLEFRNDAYEEWGTTDELIDKFLEGYCND